MDVMTTKTPTTPSARYAGLDGMRAIAVALVVVYHLFPQSPVRGGFIGVDVFFVISGFLITTLLLKEHAETGRVRLGAFWQRRARRLLPALGAVVLVCATAAWFIGGDVLVRLGEQVLGAATFSYNWVSIAGGTGYFSAATPELFRNFWSLAVEEQFYVLWPLVLPLVLLLPRAWGRAAAALALAAASAVWMGVVVSSGADLTRAYFGTDTHAFGILLGIALAFALESVLTRARTVAASGVVPALPPTVLLAPGWKIVTPPSRSAGSGSGSGAHAVLPGVAASSPRVRVVTGVAGTLALVALVALSLLPPSSTVLTFPGTVLAASLCSAVAIVAGVWPGSAFGHAIDVQPLRWIGDRSYGIYLWHWPLLVLLVAAFAGTGPDAGVPLWIGAATLALTLAAAELSYRVLESPVRRYGFRGAFARVRARLSGSPRARLRALTGVAAGVLLLGGTSAAIAAAPDVSSGQAAVLAGIDAMEDAAQGGADPSTAPSGTPAAPEAEPPASGAVDAATPAAENPVPVPSPTPVSGAEISAVGDSVMLASAPALYERLPGIQVDAAVSRSTWAGPGIVQALADSGQLRPYVVIALGTNGPVNADALEQMARIAGPDRKIVLVNAFAPRDWIPGVNADLAAFAASHPGVVVADWSSAIAPRADLLAGDQIHPGSAGARVFADTVAAAVDTAEMNRAIAQYEVELRAYRRLHHAEVRVAE
jgi:peptidoglycan/LPS O-acetylase OafA/YrhL